MSDRETDAPNSSHEDQSSEVNVPKPPVSLPQGFTPLVPRPTSSPNPDVKSTEAAVPDEITKDEAPDFPATGEEVPAEEVEVEESAAQIDPVTPSEAGYTTITAEDASDDDDLKIPDGLDESAGFAAKTDVEEDSNLDLTSSVEPLGDLEGDDETSSGDEEDDKSWETAVDEKVEEEEGQAGEVPELAEGEDAKSEDEPGISFSETDDQEGEEQDIDSETTEESGFLADGDSDQDDSEDAEDMAAEQDPNDLTGPDVASIFAQVVEEDEAAYQKDQKDQVTEDEEPSEVGDSSDQEEATEGEESTDDEDSAEAGESDDDPVETEEEEEETPKVEFRAPKVKPVMLSAAAVYPAAEADEESKEEEADIEELPEEKDTDEVELIEQSAGDQESEDDPTPETDSEESEGETVEKDETSLAVEPAGEESKEGRDLLVGEGRTDEEPAEEPVADQKAAVSEESGSSILEKLAEGNLEELEVSAEDESSPDDQDSSEEDDDEDEDEEEPESEDDDLDEDIDEDEEEEDNAAEAVPGTSEDEEDDEEPEEKPSAVPGMNELVAKAQRDKAENMEVVDPKTERTRELFRAEKQGSRWAFWRRPSKRDQQLARISEGYLEMVDLVRAIRSQLESQNENNLILRDSLAHLPEAMKGLDSFSKSQRTVGKALKEIHGQLKKSGSRDQKLVESMGGFNDTLKGMDDTSRATMRTFDRVQERMRDSDIRMENLFQNVQNTEEKVGETMVRLQRNMAIMQGLFLFCLMIVIGVLVFTVIGNWDQDKKKAESQPAQTEEVSQPRDE